MLDERWVFHENAEPVQAGPGVVRRVLAYSKDLMCVENTFEEGAVGSLHHHPHTQITYVVSGEFEFNIDGEKKNSEGRGYHAEAGRRGAWMRVQEGRHSSGYL